MPAQFWTILSPNKQWFKIFFLSCQRNCDQGLIVVRIFNFRIWNKKEHSMISSEVTSSHMGPMNIETPNIAMYIETPRICNMVINKSPYMTIDRLPSLKLILLRSSLCLRSVDSSSQSLWCFPHVAIFVLIRGWGMKTRTRFHENILLFIYCRLFSLFACRPKSSISRVETFWLNYSNCTTALVFGLKSSNEIRGLILTLSATGVHQTGWT